MVSGCSGERKTGHETTSDHEPAAIEKSWSNDSAKAQQKDTADEQAKMKQATSNSSVKTPKKDENKSTAKNDTDKNGKMNY